MTLRTAATFKSSKFNSTEQREHFVNPDCFGDDVGAWLIERLRAAGHGTEPAPGAEDFGWYVKFAVGAAKYCAVIGYAPDKGWFVVVENDKSFLGSLLGGRNRGVGAEGVAAVHRILSGAPEIRSLRWYSWKEFHSDAWLKLPGATTPDAP